VILGDIPDLLRGGVDALIVTNMPDGGELPFFLFKRGSLAYVYNEFEGGLPQKRCW
jgi:hypothetical protein